MLVPEKSPNLKARLFLDQKPISEKIFDKSLEEYFIEQKDVATTAHIEVALPNGIWPTDLSTKKIIVGNRMLTTGLNNLGNSILSEIIKNSLLYECKFTMLDEYKICERIFDRYGAYTKMETTC